MNSELNLERCPLRAKLASPVHSTLAVFAGAALSFGLGLTVVLTIGSVVLNTIDPSRLALKAERTIILRSIVSHDLAQLPFSEKD